MPKQPKLTTFTTQGGDPSVQEESWMVSPPNTRPKSLMGKDDLPTNGVSPTSILDLGLLSSLGDADSTNDIFASSQSSVSEGSTSQKMQDRISVLPFAEDDEEDFYPTTMIKVNNDVELVSKESLVRDTSLAMDDVPVDMDLHKQIEAGDWNKLYNCLIDLGQQHRQYGNDFSPIISQRNSMGETPLHTAAWKAPTKIVLALLELLPEEDQERYLLSADNDGNTPLHLACANLDAEDAVEFSAIKNILMLAPKALEATNSNGDTPVHLLASSPAFKRTDDFKVEASAEEAISSLLARSSDLTTTRNKRGATLLHVALGHGAHERVVARLVEMGPAALRLPDKDGHLPLHYVAAFGGIPWTIVAEMIKIYPLSICIQTLHGDTPLHLLMSNSARFLNKEMRLDRNTVKIAELLIGSGSKNQPSPFSIKNNEKLNAFHVAALFETPLQFIKLMMGKKDGKTAALETTALGSTVLHLLCASDAKDCLAKVEAVATPEACVIQDCRGRTPLFVAAENKKLSKKVVKHLLQVCPEAAALPTSTDYLPLHVAVRGRRSKQSVVKALIKAYPHGVKVVTDRGNTPLHEASKHNAPVSVVKLLLKKNKNAANQPNNNHELPIDRARGHGASKAIVDLLNQEQQRQFEKAKKKKDAKSGDHVSQGKPEASRFEVDLQSPFFGQC